MMRSLSFRLHTTAEEAARDASSYITRFVESNPGGLITLPTGRTPDPVYRLIRSSKVDLSSIRVVQLDEYLGVEPSSHYSCAAWLSKSLLSHTQVGDFVTLPEDGSHEAACRIELLLEENEGLDLAVLGLGENGHVGFNEPGSNPASRTRVVRLQHSTQLVNAAYWPNRAQHSEAITLGLGTILDAKKLLLLVTGSKKSEVLAKALEGPPRESVPASYLLTHRDLTVIADEAAGAATRWIDLAERKDWH